MRDKKEIILALYSALRSLEEPESLFAVSQKIGYKIQYLRKLLELIEFIQELPKIRIEKRGRYTYLSLPSPPSPPLTETRRPRSIQSSRKISDIFMEYLSDWQPTMNSLSERRWSELVKNRDAEKIAIALFPYYEQMEDKFAILAAIEDAFLELE